MKKWKELVERADKRNFHIKEFLTRSEGPELFTDAINQKLMAGLNEFPSDHMTIYDEIQATNRVTRFPSVRGVNPDLVPELGEYPLHDTTITSISVEVQKFGFRLGFSKEMLDDNEVGLMGRRATDMGRAHRELNAREHFKALSFHSTGPTVSTGVVGLRNKGVFYPQNGYTNVISATADSWETRLNNAWTQLWTQTITIGDMVIDFPVRPDTIIANPTHKNDISKVLNAGITVVAAGIGTGATNVAGSNVFQGFLQNQIYHPIIPTAQAFVLASKRGLVSVRKEGLTTEEMNNFAFDATELKTRERFLPAVVEERFICDLQISG